MIHILLGLTDKCNCNCFYCPVVHGKKPKNAKLLTTEEYINVIDQISNITKPKINHDSIIGFIGGEPLVRNDCFELMGYATKKGFAVNILTNGILINDKIARKLKKSKVTYVILTIDTLDHNKLDNIKGEDALKKILEAVKILKKHKIRIFWSTHFSKDNIYSGELKENIEAAYKYKVDVYNLFEFLDFKTSINQSNNTLKYSVTGVDKKAFQELNKILKPYDNFKSPSLPAWGHKASLIQFLLNTYKKAGWVQLENGLHFSETSKTYIGNCLCFSKEQFAVSWFGDVQPCVGNKFSYGNVRENQLKTILDYMWNHESLSFKTDDSDQMLVNSKFGFKVPQGCFAKYESALVNNVPKYKELFNKQNGYPLRIDNGAYV